MEPRGHLLRTGPQFNERGVVMAGGGTLVWKDGRRAQLDCGFMRNLVQHVQVLCWPYSASVCRMRTCCAGPVAGSCAPCTGAVQGVAAYCCVMHAACLAPRGLCWRWSL